MERYCCRGFAHLAPGKSVRVCFLSVRRGGNEEGWAGLGIPARRWYSDTFCDRDTPALRMSLGI